MTLSRKVLKRVYSPLKSPKRNNTSLRRKALIKQLSNEVQFGAASKANLKVVVRIRPQNEREEANGARCVVKVVDDHMLVFDPKEEDDTFFFKGVRQRARDLNKRQPKEQKFVFEHVFNEDSSNQDVYEATTKDIVKTVLSGYNCSVFAYGATGAGKTFTMLGKTDYPGITFLTLMELYRCIEEIKEEKTCEVRISYIEVYNEMVRDLLQPGKPLNVQEAGNQVLIPGLSLHKPNNAEELMEMLALGNHNRTQHPTDANAESSRSHAVFQVFVRQQDRTADVKSNVSIAKLSMIDLAGSERGNATGFKGARFREGASINKSLLALGNCINALADGQRHIPYRNSKLTRLLKDSIGGNCRSVMVAAVSPASSSFEDTYNTLRYANRAKTIKTTIKKNLLNVDQHVSNYVKIVEDLREEIYGLKEKVKQYEEKETEWEAQRGTLAVASTQPLDSAHQQQAEFEEKIAILEKRLQEKIATSTEPSLSEEEAEVQNKLDEANLDRKALRWELLQLESSQRETEFKIHACTARLQRLSIIAFASQRLDKSISKCERTIRNLNDRLGQIHKLQRNVGAKLSANITKLEVIQAELNQWGPNSSQPSKLSQEKIEKNETNLAVRDLHQLADYLKGLASEGFQEQNDSERLINLLLVTVKRFYVHLRAVDQCTPEIESVFKNVVENMDESKIIWADQQSDEKHASNQKETTLPLLDICHFTSLPITSNIFISPTAAQDLKKFRKSSMRSVSAAPPPDVPIQPPQEVIGAENPTLPSVTDLTTPTSLVGNFKKCALPKSPTLSVFSCDKQQTNDRLITTNLLKETRPALLTSRESNPLLMTPMKALPSTPVPSLLLSAENPTLPSVTDLTTPTSLVGNFKKCTFPKSPTLSVFSCDKQQTNDRLIATELLKETRPALLTSRESNPLLLTPMKAMPSTPVPSLLLSVKRENEAASLGYVSMVEGCLIKPGFELKDNVNRTGNNQPLESTMNATFAVSPAMCLSVLALPKVNKNGDAPVDSVESNALPINSQASGSIAEIPAKSISTDTLDSLLPNPFVSKGIPVSDVEPSVDLPNIKGKLTDSVEQHTAVNQKKMTNDTTVVMPISVSHSSDPVNSEDSGPSAELKKKCRKLFQPPVLDATFSMDEESESGENQQELKMSALNVSPGCMARKMKALGDSERRALVSLQNTRGEPARIPPAIVISPKATGVPPATQDCKGKFKKPAITPLKTPGNGTTPGKLSLTSKSITQGRLHLSVSKAPSTLRRSVSTTSLPSANYSRVAKQSPNVKKLSGFGRTLHRTTSFLKGKTSVNQENLPPQKVNFQSMSSTIFRGTVSSAAKQMGAHYKT